MFTLGRHNAGELLEVMKLVGELGPLRQVVIVLFIFIF
jgi:hypothetical protein